MPLFHFSPGLKATKLGILNLWRAGPGKIQGSAIRGPWVLQNQDTILYSKKLAVFGNDPQYRATDSGRRNVSKMEVISGRRKYMQSSDWKWDFRLIRPNFFEKNDYDRACSG